MQRQVLQRRQLPTTRVHALHAAEPAQALPHRRVCEPRRQLPQVQARLRTADVPTRKCGARRGLLGRELAGRRWRAGAVGTGLVGARGGGRSVRGGTPRALRACTLVQTLGPDRWKAK